jgi:hypothetical protein
MRASKNFKNQPQRREPMKAMTKKEYKNLPKGYKGQIAGKPYALYNDNGKTVYGPIEIIG